MEGFESNVDYGFHSLGRVPYPPVGPAEDEAEYCAVRSYRDFYDAREGFRFPQFNHGSERTTTLSPGLYPSINDTISYSHISVRLVRHPTQSHRISRIVIKVELPDLRGESGDRRTHSHDVEPACGPPQTARG